jgi:hypothetical protein
VQDTKHPHSGAAQHHGQQDDSRRLGDHDRCGDGVSKSTTMVQQANSGSRVEKAGEQPVEAVDDFHGLTCSIYLRRPICEVSFLFLLKTMSHRFF